MWVQPDGYFCSCRAHFTYYSATHVRKCVHQVAVMLLYSWISQSLSGFECINLDSPYASFHNQLARSCSIPPRSNGPLSPHGLRSQELTLWHRHCFISSLGPETSRNGRLVTWKIRLCVYRIGVSRGFERGQIHLYIHGNPFFYFQSASERVEFHNPGLGWCGRDPVLNMSHCRRIKPMD